MSLYPSLEGMVGPPTAGSSTSPSHLAPPGGMADLEVDTMARVQVALAVQQQQQQQQMALTGGVPAGGAQPPAAGGSLYAGLGLEEFLDYGGLDISAAALAAQLPGVRPGFCL